MLKTDLSKNITANPIFQDSKINSFRTKIFFNLESLSKDNFRLLVGFPK
ncbi:hypothetical protein LEP1GSC062_2165 [Leptospira alexanderi serovar Manhao 3 str. L 60]|uniref:Uncharacterized protein n=1 Tax=Leptospira alexanderi serovar Manhao 3 str. L 60 TaxID=1049759 RepID=V6I703_9LEPT|nr:hypothetical protein LEP1GSC062_2165 [Leptospira alexanderi serovar Manhao 3 str. L 60]